jgi:hypothetical protein
MTVDELKEYLNLLPGDLQIIVGSDDEGNDFVDLFTPAVMYCTEADNSSGWVPVHEDDVGTEYHVDDLVKKVVM